MHDELTISAAAPAGRKTLCLQRFLPTPLSEGEISRAISCARVLLISSLVFVHYIDYPFGTMLDDAGKAFQTFPVMTFLSRELIYVNSGLIILLSCVSGWLFFRFSGDDWLKLRRKMKRRLFSLMTPLLFWCGLYLVVLAAIAAFDPQSPMLVGFNFDFVHPTWRDYADGLLGLGAYPVDYPFWFMRDLLVSVLASPLLWLALKRAPYAAAAILAVIWIGNINFGIFYKPDVLCFFYFGGLMRVKKVPLGLDFRLTLVCVALVIAFAALRAVAPALMPDARFDHAPLSVVVRIFRIFGVLAAWGLFTRLARMPISTSIAKLGGLSIYFFAAHAIFLAGTKLLLAQLIPLDTDGWQLTHYVLSIGITIAVTYATGAAVLYLSPSFFDFITGGRAEQNRTDRPVAGPGMDETAAAVMPVGLANTAQG
jgi:hypothetical protein